MGILETAQALKGSDWLIVVLITSFLTLIGWELAETKGEITHRRVLAMLSINNQKKTGRKDGESFVKRVYGMLEERVTVFLEKQIRKGNFNSLTLKLKQANIHDIQPLQFWSKKILFAIGGTILGILMKDVRVIIGLGVAGFFYPDIKLKEKIKKRQDQIKRELPEFLDLVAATFPACSTLEETLKQVCQRKTGEVADEFRTTLEEINTGRKRHEALKDLALRCGIDEVKTMVSQINQSDLFGNGLDETLRVQSNKMRKMKKYMAENRAKKAGQLLFLPGGLLLITSIIMIVGPSMVEFLGTMQMFG